MQKSKELKAFNRLLHIMDDLRLKCPWDKKQTMESLRHLTIEEVYELGDAILDNDLEEVKKELGDVLLHIVFYAKIGSETNSFDIADVCDSISDKLIDRHPHIYGDVEVSNEEDVKRNWEQLKLKEGKKSVLEGVPQSLPAMVKANRIQDKVSGVGFDWEASHQVFDNLLSTHVTDTGTVNYSAFKKDQFKLDKYLATLRANHPSESWTKNERLAYWINAYNAYTVQLILDNYPLKSIKDLNS